MVCQGGSLGSLWFTTDTPLYTISTQPDGLKPHTPHTTENSVLREYHDYLDVFSKEQADTLPPHRPYDHKIVIEETATLLHGRIYSMSELELRTLRDHLEKELVKGFIRPSSSPTGALVLFIKKKDGLL